MSLGGAPWQAWEFNQIKVMNDDALAVGVQRRSPEGGRWQARSSTEETQIMSRMSAFNSPLLLGFDHLEQMLDRASRASAEGYPPYNIVKESDSSYSISLAVAGFNKDEIKIEQDGNTLSINAEKKPIKEEIEYLHKGIGTRNFTKEFSLADYVEVTSSKLDNGILVVTLEQNIPDEKKPRTIKID